MKNHAKTPAAANGKAASPASSSSAAALDRAFLADGRRFLASLRAAAKSAGVPLGEYLIRAAFEAERSRPEPEVAHAGAPFIRAAVRYNEAMEYRAFAGIVGHAACDMMPPGEDGQPTRAFPAAFALAPDCHHKEAARWMCPREFFFAFDLQTHAWEENAIWSRLVEHPSGRYIVEMIGEAPREIGQTEWVSSAVACWYFGLAPDHVESLVKKGWLRTTTGAEPCVSLSAVAGLLGWLEQHPNAKPPTVVLPFYGARRRALPSPAEVTASAA